MCFPREAAVMVSDAVVREAGENTLKSLRRLQPFTRDSDRYAYDRLHYAMAEASAWLKRSCEEAE